MTATFCRTDAARWFREVPAVMAIVLALGLATLEPAPAHAAAPTVTVGSSSQDQGASTITLSDVHIVYPGDTATSVMLHSIVLHGAEVTADSVRAAEVDVDGISATLPGSVQASLSAETMILKSLSSPLPSETSLGATPKPGEMPALVAWLLAAKAESIRIPAMSLSVKIENVTSTAQFRDIVLDGVDAGRVAHMTIGSAEQSSLADPPYPASKARAGKTEIVDLDMGAYAVWFDDGLAAAAKPDKRLIYRSFRVEGIAEVRGDTTVSIDHLSGEGVKLGPPRKRPSEIAALIGKMEADPNYGDEAPAEVLGFVRDVLDAIEIDSVEIGGMSVAEATKPPAAIGLVRIENFGGTHIGEIRFGDLAFADKDEGTAVKIGSFAIRGFDLADLDAFLEQLATSKPESGIIPQDWPKPRIAGLALSDVDALVPGKGHFTVDGVTLDTPDWVGLSPVTVHSRLQKLVVPVAALEEASSRELLSALGHDSVSLDGAFDFSWHEADETLMLGPASLDLAGIGRIEVSSQSGGVPKSVFEHPDTAEEALATLDFRGATLALRDGGGLAQFFDIAARTQGTTRTRLAVQISQEVEGGMIAMLGLDDAAKRVATALKRFIQDPKSLAVTVTTTEPIPAAAFMEVGNGNSDALEVIKKSIRVEAAANP